MSTFLNRLNIYDQHRDMRLDIDNMTYEVSRILLQSALIICNGFDSNLSLKQQLLDLEEGMGTVSTALSEKELTECLHRSIYQSKPEGGMATGSVEDLSDVKCCICQVTFPTLPLLLLTRSILAPGCRFSF